MIIETRFDVGETVYKAHARWDQKQIQCPDCLGTKCWEAHLPNGEVIAGPSLTAESPARCLDSR
jgi:hypothetical protein